MLSGPHNVHKVCPNNMVCTSSVGSAQHNRLKKGNWSQKKNNKTIYKSVACAASLSISTRCVRRPTKTSKQRTDNIILMYIHVTLSQKQNWEQTKIIKKGNRMIERMCIVINIIKKTNMSAGSEEEEYMHMYETAICNHKKKQNKKK